MIGALADLGKAAHLSGIAEQELLFRRDTKFVARGPSHCVLVGRNRSHTGMIMAQWDLVMVSRREDEWVWGWDSTPGIVSVWADLGRRGSVWRRIPNSGELVREEARFQQWLLLDRLDDLQHLGDRLGPEGCEKAPITYREPDGPSSLRYLVSTDDGRALIAVVIEGATRWLGRRVPHLRESEKETVLALAPEEQYLATTGRTYFRDLAFDQLHRMQFDLETTGLNPARDRIFMIAVRYPSRATGILRCLPTGMPVRLR